MYIHTKGIQTTHGEIWNNKKFIFSFLYAESRIVMYVYNILYRYVHFYILNGRRDSRAMPTRPHDNRLNGCTYKLQ